MENTARSLYDFAFNTKGQRFPLWVILPFLLVEVVLCSAIILKVPYTEIDWKAYMEQVSQYLAGERNYAMIKGATGPLVYPAAHVYIYSLLYKITNHGTDIARAQWLFAGLYLVTLTIVLLCYREARAPPYILPLLVLSRRLHSIYILRLFNDPWAIFFFFVAVFAWQKRLWTLGSTVYSLAVGVKMNTLLVLPAIGAIYLQAIGRNKALRQASIMAQIQFLLASPFLMAHPYSYLSRAFDFTRRFLYKWTVNWRFVDEKTFLSKEFTYGLLVLHVIWLLIFLQLRWKGPSKRSIAAFFSLILFPAHGLEEYQIRYRVTSQFVLSSVLAANTVGMLCARSLHYQFFSWLSWGTPYVLWCSGLGPLWIVPIWAAQEWAWNIYPSTTLSSGVVVGTLALGALGMLVGHHSPALEEITPRASGPEKEKRP